MSTRRLRHFAPALLLVLCFAALPASAKRLDGVFTAVKDANVVVLDYGEGSYDVRIYGTEAPADGQPFAAEARAFVREALLGKNGAMRFKYRNEKDEMVSRIFYFDSAGRERDLGVDLAAAGLAWLRPGAKYRPVEEGQPDQLTAAQAEAQAARRGIWSTDRPVAPWSFRGEALEAEAMTSGYPGEAAGYLDVNISKRSGGDNECAIAKDPSNPLRLAAHCNSLATPWISGDGGLTWTVGGSIGSYCCDPNLAFDSFGNLFATFINGATNAIVTLLSTNGGTSFSPLASFSGSIDQPSVVAHDGTVWIVWNSSGNMVARGATVTGLGTVGAFVAQQTAPTTTSCSFGDLAVSPVAPHAVVQVCVPSGGQTGGNIRINVDADGLGAGVFGASIVATTTLVGGFDFIPAQSHRSIDAEAGLTFDRNPASPHYGRLYLVYTDEATQENNDTNIMLRYSDDTGATWSAPLQVNTDATTRSQFLPKIASDPATGNVAICWHDARNSAGNTAMQEWCDSFTAAGFPTFQGNVQVSDGASLSTDASMDFGDYSGLTMANGTAHPIWADSSNSTGDNPNGTAAFDAYTDRFPFSSGALFALDVTVSGSGTVTSAPAGINCPGDCTESYADGTPVALTAAAASGWQFAGWTGACTGTGACNVSMTQARAVTATFAQLFALDVTVAGGGTVTSAPAGINCPGDCTESYADGTPVALTAAAASGWQFTGWTGACAGAGACNVSMTQARAVTATFTHLFALDVILAGTGTVTSAPAGINCPGDCAESYLDGTPVALTPAASGDWRFVGWSGGCTGSGACDLSMTQARSVTATFDTMPFLDGFESNSSSSWSQTVP